MNNILVGCDDIGCKAFFQNLFANFDSPVTVTVVNTIDELVSTVRKKIPDIIVLHIVKQEGGYFSWLKKLRKVKGSDEIPILIYTGLPGKADIPALLEILFNKKKGLQKSNKKDLRKELKVTLKKVKKKLKNK